MADIFLTIMEAAEYANVSRVKIWRMIRDGKLQSYANPRDGREKLVKRDELDAALSPVPIRQEEKQAAA